MRGSIASAALALGVLGVNACAGPDADTGLRVVEADSAGVAMVDIVGDPTSLPAWGLSGSPLTVLSGDAPPFLTDVGEVAFLPGGELLVEDNRSAEIHVVAANGRVSTSIGGSGDGPGEFRNVTELSLVDDTTAVVFDRRLSRATRFAQSGRFLGSLALERSFGGRGTIAYDAWPLADRRTLLHVLAPLDTSTTAPVPRIAPRDGLLFILDSLGAVLHGPKRFTGGLAMVGQRFDGASPFSSEALVAVGAETLIRGSGLEFELHVESPELRLKRVIRWPGWSSPLAAESVAAVRDTVSAGFEQIRQRRPEAVAAILDAMFAPNSVPALLPALQRAIVDDTGRIWVARYRPAPYRWREDDSWFVLDPTGRPLARLPLPPNTRLVAVRGDDVALVTRDEFEVQHLRVFRLVGP